MQSKRFTAGQRVKFELQNDIRYGTVINAPAERERERYHEYLDDCMVFVVEDGSVHPWSGFNEEFCCPEVLVSHAVMLRGI